MIFSYYTIFAVYYNCILVETNHCSSSTPLVLDQQQHWPALRYLVL